MKVAYLLVALTFIPPVYADSMLGTLPVAPPPLGSPATAPATGERWTINVLVTVNGAFINGVQYGDTTYPSGEACKNAVLGDADLKSSAKVVAEAAARKYGPTAGTVITCAMELE
jgi:hypothetical protein